MSHLHQTFEGKCWVLGSWNPLKVEYCLYILTMSTSVDSSKNDWDLLSSHQGYQVPHDINVKELICTMNTNLWTLFQIFWLCLTGEDVSQRMIEGRHTKLVSKVSTQGTASVFRCRLTDGLLLPSQHGPHDVLPTKLYHLSRRKLKWQLHKLHDSPVSIIHSCLCTFTDSFLSVCLWISNSLYKLHTS